MGDVRPAYESLRRAGRARDACPEDHSLDSPRIPSPLNLTGVHIDQVNTESMYARLQFGLLQMDRKTLPEMVRFTSARHRWIVAGSPRSSRY